MEAPFSSEWTTGVNPSIKVISVFQNFSIQGNALILTAESQVVATLGRVGLMISTNGGTRVLNGFSGPITATAVSQDGNLVALADSGAQNSMIVFNLAMLSPIRVWFTPHELGTISISFCHDNDLMASLSSLGCAVTQTVTLWRVSQEERILTIELSGGTMLNMVLFNRWDPVEMVCSGPAKVIFLKISESSLTSYEPGFDRDHLKHPKKGLFTQSTFLRDFALTGTGCGEVVVWESENCQRKAAKIVMLCSESEPSLLVEVNGLLALGCKDGAVRIFDEQLRILRWFDNIKLGSIRSIAFAPTAQCDIPQFAVLTGSAKLLLVDPEDSSVSVIMSGFNSEIVCLVASPHKPIIVASSRTDLQIWNIESRELVCEAHFVTSPVSALAASDAVVVVGFESGCLRLLDFYGKPAGEVLEATGPVLSISFSSSQDKVVYALKGCIRLVTSDVKGLWTCAWELPAHSLSDICGLGWLSEREVCTLAVDGRLAVIAVSPEAGKLTSETLVCRDSTPLGFKIDEQSRSIEIFDGEFKVRSYALIKDTCICTKVRLGPVFYTSDGAIAVPPAHSILKSVCGFSAFACGGLVGVWRHGGDFFGRIVQSKTKRLLLAVAGDRLFTGGEYGALEEFKFDAAKFSAIDPLQGSLSPDLARESREIFCLSQIRAKGESETAGRHLDGHLPLSRIREALNGLGLFPSDWDLKNIESELGKPTIRFEEFLSIYLHHRPVVPESARVRAAREVLVSRGLSLDAALLMGSGKFDSGSELAESIARVNRLDPYLGFGE